MAVLLRNDSGEKLRTRAIAGICRRLLRLCGQERSELSVMFTNDPAIRELNGKYRRRDKATNVLSFPQQEGEPDNGLMLGDIVISVDTAAREARELGQSLHTRFQKLLIHGLIHLLGMDHERSAAEAVLMRRREEELYQQLIKERRLMPHLAINVDHIATLRQARGINEPDPVLAAGICELAGACGIVAHLREDRRHMQDRDIRLLRQTVKTKLNMEMGAAPEIIAIALDIHPDMVTLVPEKRQELTTEGGLDVAGQHRKISRVIKDMHQDNIPVSLFIDPDITQVKAALEAEADFVEIHTGRYCDAENEDERNREFDLAAETALFAYNQGLRVNAGHGLNYQTTARIAALDSIEELSIGHAVMARAIIVGLTEAVREMAAIIRQAAL
ncbi:pyridoxine 5'-phosphate synthase [Desulfobacterota bacterium M19]